MKKIILHEFGKVDLIPWKKLLESTYPNISFSIGEKIPTLQKFRIGTVIDRVLDDNSSVFKKNIKNKSELYFGKGEVEIKERKSSKIRRLIES